MVARTRERGQSTTFFHNTTVFFFFTLIGKVKATNLTRTLQTEKPAQGRGKYAHLPSGLINHGNTTLCSKACVSRLNVSFGYFIGILVDCHTPSERPGTLLPPSHLRYNDSPRPPQPHDDPLGSNRHHLNGEWDKPWVNSMPTGDMFLNWMFKHWRADRQPKVDARDPCAETT